MPFPVLVLRIHRQRPVSCQNKLILCDSSKFQNCGWGADWRYIADYILGRKEGSVDKYLVDYNHDACVNASDIIYFHSIY
mgnify:CR=1 FL=1